mmetsp:Transcript_38457/g.121135  ORF Transcript_38457/g.121135 Transcript_38457/m.121135 type:complete len:665 (-) Transcript_38457:18-2012(-)
MARGPPGVWTSAPSASQQRAGGAARRATGIVCWQSPPRKRLPLGCPHRIDGLLELGRVEEGDRAHLDRATRGRVRRRARVGEGGVEDEARPVFPLVVHLEDEALVLGLPREVVPPVRARVAKRVVLSRPVGEAQLVGEAVLLRDRLLVADGERLLHHRVRVVDRAPHVDEGEAARSELLHVLRREHPPPQPRVDALGAQLLQPPRRPRRRVVAVHARHRRRRAARRRVEVCISALSHGVVEDEHALGARRGLDQVHHLAVVRRHHRVVVLEVVALRRPRLQREAERVERSGRVQLARVAHRHLCGDMLVHDVPQVRLVDVPAGTLAGGRRLLVVELHGLRHPVGELERGVRAGRDLVHDGLELARRLHLLPIGPDLGADRLDGGLGPHRRVPRREARERRRRRVGGGGVEQLRPAEEARQHELHEDTGGEPSQVGESELAQQVRPVGGVWVPRELVEVQPRHHRPPPVARLELRLEPAELPPDLGNLGGARGQVHAPLGPVPAVGEVHGALRVREAGRGRVWARDVQVVHSAEQLHRRPALGRARRESRAGVAVLVLEKREDDVGLEHGRSVGQDERRHLLERVDSRKVSLLQVGVGEHPALDRVAHPARALECHPKPHTCRIVAVAHVEEDWLLERLVQRRRGEGGAGASEGTVEVSHVRVVL